MKNKIMLFGVFLLLAVLTAGTAVAEIQANDVSLGSSTQERGETLSLVPWVITNTGTTPVSDLQITLIDVKSSNYALTFTLDNTTVAPNSSVNVYFSAFIPLNQDSGKEIIAKAQVTGTGTNGFVKTIYLETANHLVIDNVKVKVDGSTDKLTSPDTVSKTADLGDEIVITIKVQNTFDEEMKIDNIELNVDSNDLDSADGLDDSLSRLYDGDDDTMEVSFIIDKEDTDPQDAPFSIILTVTGQDENGANHEESWEIRLDMDSKSRDVRLINTVLSKTILSCTDKEFRVDYDLRNVGTRDTDNAMVKFEVPELNIGFFERNLEISEGDIESFSSRISIPNDAEPGIYFLDITAYATDKTSDKSDVELLSFEIKKCTTTTTGTTTTGKDDKTDNDSTGITVNTGGQTTTTTEPVEVTGVPVSTSQGSRAPLFGDAQGYIIALAIIVVILLVAVLVLIISLLRK